MLGYINHLKTKPEHIRRRYAYLISFSFTFIVFAGWIVSSYGINSNSIVADATDSDTKSDKVVLDTPTSSLSATAIGAWNDIKNIFLGSNKVELSNSIEVIPGNR